MENNKKKAVESLTGQRAREKPAMKKGEIMLFAPAWKNGDSGSYEMASVSKRRWGSTIRLQIREWTSIILALTTVFSIEIGSALAQAPAGCPPPNNLHKFDPQSPNLGHVKLWLREYRCSRYDIEVTERLAEARVWIEQHAGHVMNPAIVLDIDETSLSNWEQIYRNDFGYIRGGACDKDPESACGQRAWEVSASAVAVQPTLQLFNAAKARSIAVFFITGRYDDPVMRAATEENLHKAGYHGWNDLFLRPESTRGRPVAEYKTAIRAGIEAAHYTIIANIGDQESDLANGYAEKTFKVPNPFYFIP